MDGFFLHSSPAGALLSRVLSVFGPMAATWHKGRKRQADCEDLRRRETKGPRPVCRLRLQPYSGSCFDALFSWRSVHRSPVLKTQAVLAVCYREEACKRCSNTYFTLWAVTALASFMSCLLRNLQQNAKPTGNIVCNPSPLQRSDREVSQTLVPHHNRPAARDFMLVVYNS